MKANNLLADHVDVSRPEALELRLPLRIIARVADPAHVARQRVVPHVEHVLRIARPRNSPFDRLSADRNVLQPGRNEALHFVEAKIRLYEIRMRTIEVQ